MIYCDGEGDDSFEADAIGAGLGTGRRIGPTAVGVLSSPPVTIGELPIAVGDFQVVIRESTGGEGGFAVGCGVEFALGVDGGEDLATTRIEEFLAFGERAIRESEGLECGDVGIGGDI